LRDVPCTEQEPGGHTLMRSTFIGDRQCVDDLTLFSGSHAFISSIIIRHIRQRRFSHWRTSTFVAGACSVTVSGKISASVIISRWNAIPLAFEQDIFIFLTAYFSFSLIRHAEISRAEISCRCTPLHVYDVKRIQRYHMFIISMSVSMFHARPLVPRRR